MKQTLFAVIVLSFILFSNDIEAQVFGTNPTFSASIYGATTHVDFSSDGQDDDLVEYKSNFGYGVHFGYSENLNEASKINFQIGLITASWYADEDFLGGTYEFEALYLTMQPSVQRSFGSIFLKFGGFLDYGLAGTNTLPSGNEFDIFEDEALNRTNSGLVLGAGLDISDAAKGVVDVMWGTPDNYFFEIFADYRWGLSDVEGVDDDNNQTATLSFITFGIRGNF